MARSMCSSLLKSLGSLGELCGLYVSSEVMEEETGELTSSFPPPPLHFRSSLFRCATCRLTSFNCPGHFGHISLPNPVFQPLFFTQAYALVRQCCMYCHRFRGSEGEVRQTNTRSPFSPSVTHAVVPAAFGLELITLAILPSRWPSLLVGWRCSTTVC